MKSILTAAALALTLISAHADDEPGSPPPSADKYAQKKLDAKFLQAAYSGNMLEIKLSQYAIDQLKTHKDVEKLAQMLVKHHTEAKQKVREAAEKSGVELSEELLPLHKATLDMAEETKGELFHVPYLFHLASSHVMGILAVSHRGHYTEDPAVKGYCDFALPLLKMHYGEIKPMAEDEAKLTSLTK